MFGERNQASEGMKQPRRHRWPQQGLGTLPREAKFTLRGGGFWRSLEIVSFAA
jgi:hypothetical protein